METPQAPIIAPPTTATPDVKALDDYKKYFDDIRNVESQILKKEAEIAKIKIVLQNPASGQRPTPTPTPVNKQELSNKLNNLRNERKTLRQRQLEFIQKAVDFKNKASKFIGISNDEFEDYFEEVYGSENSFIDAEEMFLDTVDAMEEFASDISFDFESAPNPNTKEVIKRLLNNEREIVVGMSKVAKINNHVGNVMKDMAKAEEKHKNSIKALQETLDKLQLNRNAIQANINERISKSDIIVSELAALKKVAYDGEEVFAEFGDTNVGSTSGYAENIYGTSSFYGIFDVFSKKSQAQKDADYAEKQRQRRAKFDLSMEAKRNKEDLKRGIAAQKAKDEVTEARLDKANERSLAQRALNEQPADSIAVKSDANVAGKENNTTNSKSSNEKMILGIPQKTVIIGGVVLLVVIIIAIVVTSKK